MSKKVVLAYSGGLDTSIIIPWLNENYGMDVIAMIADVGQAEDLDEVVKKAYATGAKKAVVLDLRDEFVREYVYPTVRAGAIYEHKYLLGTSIARPVIAKHQVAVALAEGAGSGGPRLHRQGKRPGTFRARVPGARARSQGHRSLAGVDTEVARRLSRLRGSAWHPRGSKPRKRSTPAIATCGTSATRAANWKMPATHRWPAPG